jgi:hypothetical protein
MAYRRHRFEPLGPRRGILVVWIPVGPACHRLGGVSLPLLRPGGQDGQGLTVESLEHRRRVPRCHIEVEGRDGRHGSRG